MTELEDTPDVVERFQGSLDLVEIIARQVARSVGPAADLAELVSYGREGLLDAARRFDPERGVPFRGYANFRVRGSIIDGLRSVAHLPRRIHEKLRGLAAANSYSEGAWEDVSSPPPPGATHADADRALAEHLAGMATAMAMGLVASIGRGEEGEMIGVGRESSPEEATSQGELMALVRETIETLPDQEAELVRRHYLEGERFDYVAADLGLSKSWASRLHTRAMTRLSKRLRAATR